MLENRQGRKVVIDDEGEKKRGKLKNKLLGTMKEYLRSEGVSNMTEIARNKEAWNKIAGKIKPMV